MVTQLPVPIEFRLPDGWFPVQPDEAGAPESAFVALHPHPSDDFTANITIAGNLRLDDAALPVLADESVHRLREAVGSVRIRDRNELGSADAPGLTQILDVDTTINNRPRELVQCQVYLTMADVHEPTKRAVIELALTCTPTQFDTVIGDFQQFVRTVRPDQDRTELNPDS